jgi:hypothetical protein
MRIPVTYEMRRAGVVILDSWLSEDEAPREHSLRCRLVTDIFRAMLEEAQRQAPGPTIAPSAEPPEGI